jgi:site-specific DNA-cytosine methylase
MMEKKRHLTNVLSLFDGMSCGQIALGKAGITYDKYYASEIDKHAIKVAMHNYPNTVQLGDVTQVRAEDLPQIDLLIGGSPCQGFSFSGKQLNFSDPRSKLFFEFVRLVKECKPKYWMLENVAMKKEYEDVISEHLGVSPVVATLARATASPPSRRTTSLLRSLSGGILTRSRRIFRSGTTRSRNTAGFRRSLMTISMGWPLRTR